MTADASALTGTAIREVAELAQEAASPHVAEYGGYQFSDKPLHRVDADPRQPEPREFYTLDGLVKFLLHEPATTQALVHVVSPIRVDVVSRLYGADDHCRDHLASAVCKSAAMHGFSFNNFVPLETLNIALQTCFEPKRGRIDDLRKFCAAVRSSQTLGTADDGVSQTVEAKAGIAAVVAVPVVNPWDLAPWRTFPEVEQPLSAYILRFLKGEEPRAGLFETGNTQWQVDAVKAIAAFLSDAIGVDWPVLG